MSDWTAERIAKDRTRYAGWMRDPADEGTAEYFLAEAGCAALDEIERLQAETGKLRRVRELKDEGHKRFAPCSDHSGKVGLSYQEWQCQWCRAEHAERMVERLQARVAELKAQIDGARQTADETVAMIKDGYRVMLSEVPPDSELAARIRAELGDGA